MPHLILGITIDSGEFSLPGARGTLSLKGPVFLGEEQKKSF